MSDGAVVAMPIVGRFAGPDQRAQHLIDAHKITDSQVDALDAQEQRDYHTYLHTNAARHGRRHVHRGGM